MGDIVETTEQDLHEDLANREHPTFQVYPKASLLIVVGSRGAIDIARKVVNALPGQQMAAEEASLEIQRRQRALLHSESTPPENEHSK